MSKVLVTQSYLEDIANAIRAKNGESGSYYPSQMASKIMAIPSSGGGGGSVDENGMILDDWATVISLVESGQSNYEVGNYKPLDLGTEGIVNMQIVAFDADALADGSGNASSTWISKELLGTNHIMNPAREGSSGAYVEGTGTIGGWSMCGMRTYLRGTIKPLIPSDVRSAIKEVTKYSRIFDSTGSAINDSVSTDDVWIPSKHEVSTSPIDTETQGAVYREAFPNEASRIKLPNGAWWWLRSADSSENFYNVNHAGTIGSGPVSDSISVALGFCI